MAYYICEFHHACKFSAMYYRNNSFSSGKTSKNIRCFPSCFNGTSEIHCPDNFCGYPVTVTITCVLTDRFDMRGAIFLGEFVHSDKDEDLEVYSTVDDILDMSGLHKHAFIGVVAQSTTYISDNGMKFISVTAAFNTSRKAYVFNQEGNKLMGIKHVFRVSAYHYMFNRGWQCIASGSSPRFSIKCTRRKNSSNDKIISYSVCSVCGSEITNRELPSTCSCGAPISPSLVAQPRKFSVNVELPECQPGIEILPILCAAHTKVMKKMPSAVTILGEGSEEDDDTVCCSNEVLIEESEEVQGEEKEEVVH